MMLINMCAETIKPFLKGTKSDQLYVSIYQVYLVSHITGEGRAEIKGVGVEYDGWFCGWMDLSRLLVYVVIT